MISNYGNIYTYWSSFTRKARLETTRANLLDIFYKHVEESDWLEGLDLYQSGKVDSLINYSGLITAKVLSNIKGPLEVRLKIHPSGKRIQWIECTCPKYRRSGRYCEHMAAFMINIDRESPQLLGSLDSQMPLKPPTSVKKIKQLEEEKKTTDSPNKNQGAAQNILHHLHGNIHSISLLARGPSIRVRLEIKPGTLTHYNLKLDEAAKFLTSHSKNKSVSSDIRELKVYSSEVLRGTFISQSESEQIVAERVFVLRHNARSISKAQSELNTLNTTSGEFTYISETNKLKPRKGLFEFISVKSASKHIGKEYIFLPRRGYWPIETNGWKQSWHDLPLRKTFKGDDAARLIKSGFKQYLEAGPIWIEDSLNSPNIEENLVLQEIRILKTKGDWYFLDPKYGLEDGSISMIELMQHFRQKKRNFIKSGKSWLKIPEFIKDHKWNLDDTGKYLKVNATGFMRIKAAVGDFDQFVGSKKILEKIRSTMEFAPGGKLPSLSHTNLKLRSYQSTGLEWMWWLYNNNLHGLLADEMGLGKTHQSMALISAIQETNKNAIFLVVAPTTVIDHWIDKVNEFAPNLKPLKHHGSRRLSSLTSLSDQNKLIVTSYGVLLRDAKFLSEQQFEAVILDEAHFIKNNVTATYKAVCKLQARFRMCLTGTPMENHLGELKNIFDFLMPGYLGSDEYFKKNFLDPIQEKSDQSRETELQKLIHPFKLRRTKDLVLKDLPPKVEDYRHCELSKDQIKLYQSILKMKASPIVEQLENNEKPVPFLHVFHTLTLLKQICNHPALVQKDIEYSKLTSGKFEVFKEVIREAIESDHKIVVYSQYVDMIKIFEKYLSSMSIGHVKLTGQTRNRGKVIQSFQEDSNIKVFCGSLLAGGIGIDLTAASVVIHYDRWWNASKENQATDRVHRIGQHNNVQVLKFLTRGTLEEKIDMIIRSKQFLFERFLDKDEEIFKKLNRQQLIELLT